MPGSHIEAKEHDIALGNPILLAFQSHAARIPRPAFSAIAQVIVECDDFSTNKAALKIRVDFAGRLRGGRSFGWAFFCFTKCRFVSRPFTLWCERLVKV